MKPMRRALAWALPCLLATFLAVPATAETWREPVTGMEFVAIPKGCYQMGLPDDAFKPDSGLFSVRLRAEQPAHEVCLDGFWMGRHEVRAVEWQQVMGTPPVPTAADVPVTGVSWEAARRFAQRLTELSEGKARYRLPTEAEWEYACRAGGAPVKSELQFGKLAGQAWYSAPQSGDPGKRSATVQPVGRKAANPFGLHDMLGNAWEWVADTYRAEAYTQHTLYNPVVSGPGDRRVIRGGGIRTEARMTRCETRAWLSGEAPEASVGIRLVRIREEH